MKKVVQENSFDDHSDQYNRSRESNVQISRQGDQKLSSPLIESVIQTHRFNFC